MKLWNTSATPRKAKQAGTRAASSPSKGQEQPIHARVGHRYLPAPKPSSCGKPKEHLHWKIKACSASLAAQVLSLDEEMRGSHTTQHSRMSPWALCLSSPPGADRNITSNLTMLKGVRNPPVSKHAHAINWYNERKYVFGLACKSSA